METLQRIAKKQEIAAEKEKKRLEKELTKETKEAERQKKIAQERRAHDKEAKRLANTAEAIASQEEAKKQFKEKWTTKACEQVGQRLHDLMKEGGGIPNPKLYLERQPLACKKNQEIAIAKLKAKRNRNKHGTPISCFELPLMLLHFHGVKEYCLQQ